MPLQPDVLAVAAAIGLDWSLGDPCWILHPVVVMGWWIQTLRRILEPWAQDSPWRLRLSGGFITLALVCGSGLVGWGMEWLSRAAGPWGWPVLVVALASALAGRSLHGSVMTVLQALPDAATDEPTLARQKLSWIVGRDVSQLDRVGILRACAETASENAVDGLFAPLFWMAAGCLLWRLNPAGPGPLALAWMFKASSTLDSMLGYRRGLLRWLGTAGARLDDLLTWLPCRLVMLTLPLVSAPWNRWFALVRAAERDGAADPSPNAGRSEAIYAHCAEVRLGGRNRYGATWVEKPLLAADRPEPDRQAIQRILSLTIRLELLWIVLLGLIQ